MIIPYIHQQTLVQSATQTPLLDRAYLVLVWMMMKEFFSLIPIHSASQKYFKNRSRKEHYLQRERPSQKRLAVYQKNVSVF
jgi:hypothetical protein